MDVTLRDYIESATAIRASLGSFVPEVMLILGSGLSWLGDTVKDPVKVHYADIPHFKRSTAPGHPGRLIFGTLQGRRVAVMQGRFHRYEGYDFADIALPVRVLRLLGAEKLIVTNAAGAVNLGFQAGDLMLITDHIKLIGDSPLRGPNLPEFGPRFPDATHLYDPELCSLARETAAELEIPLREGVYMYMPGPQYETPAEVRAIRILGADAVGMSTVPEVVAAAHCGMRVLGFTLLSNMAAGILDQPLSEQEVLDAGEAGREKFSRLVLRCLERM